jgi:hypothetical protein
LLFLNEANLVVIGIILQLFMHSCIIERTFFSVKKVVNAVVDVFLWFKQNFDRGVKEIYGLERRNLCSEKTP